MLTKFPRVVLLAALLVGCSPSGSADPTSTSATGQPGATTGTGAATGSHGAATGPLGAATGQPASSAPSVEAATPERYAERLVWAPSGKRVAVWCGTTCLAAPPSEKGTRRTIHLLDLPAGTGGTVDLENQRANVPRYVAFSPRETRLLVTAGDDLRLFDVARRTWLLSMGRIQTVDAFAASPTDSHVAMISTGAGLEIWEAGTVPQWLSGYVRYDMTPGAVAWLPSGKRVVFTGPADAPELWGMQKRVARLNVTGMKWTRPVVRVTSDGTVAVASGDGTVALFDGDTGKAKSVLRKPLVKGEAGTSVVAALSPDDKRFAVATGFGELTVIDLGGRVSIDLVAASSPPSPLGAVAWSPDGALLAYESGGGVFVVPALESGAKGAAPKEKPSPVKASDGSLLGFGADGTVLLRLGSGEVVGWSDGKEKWRLPLSARDSGVALSPDRKLLALTDGAVRLFRLRDGKTVTLLLGGPPGKPTLTPAPGATPEDVKALLAD